MTANLYGIPTCDTVRKARKWLTDNGIDHQFIDVRENTPPKSQVDHWVRTLGAAKMVNKRSTTWKNLSDTDRAEAESGDTCLLYTSPSPRDVEESRMPSSA